MQFCFLPSNPANLADGYMFATVLDGQPEPAGAYCIPMGEYIALSYEDMQARLSGHFGGSTPTASPKVAPEPTPEPTPEESPEESPEEFPVGDPTPEAKSAKGRK
jgi:hypothetical protein